MNDWEYGNKQYCPKCEKSGVKQQYVCYTHGYRYKKWYDGWKKGGKKFLEQ